MVWLTQMRRPSSQAVLDGWRACENRRQQVSLVRVSSVAWEKCVSARERVGVAVAVVVDVAVVVLVLVLVGTVSVRSESESAGPKPGQASGRAENPGCWLLLS